MDFREKRSGFEERKANVALSILKWSILWYIGERGVE